MTMNRPVAAGLALGLVLMISGCGGAGSASSSAAASSTGSLAASTTGSAPDACSLVAQEEVIAILGSDPGPGVSKGNVCNYGDPVVGVVGWAMATDYEALVEEESTIFTNAPVEVSNVGDAAVSFEDPDGAALIVQAGNYAVVAGAATLDQAGGLMSATLTTLGVSQRP